MLCNKNDRLAGLGTSLVRCPECDTPHMFRRVMFFDSHGSLQEVAIVSDWAVCEVEQHCNILEGDDQGADVHCRCSGAGTGIWWWNRLRRCLGLSRGPGHPAVL